ncbi:MAG: tRNA (5-methylaminomethyl-2-thiouridine)(34)-methyltransferase MnmD [Cardiobacteriaceae bacterium]|nr:tRNA (5-methylaminomethyl-2-thiouridine)(34)-methyltransferase MnmD [Cardiobacteriaceae bacterium]
MPKPLMLLEYAPIHLDSDGQPYNNYYQDIYYNPGQGFAESEHVFINGNRLHERFALIKNHFVIGEIGFGTGLNFIHSANTFLHEAPASTRLHYISFERHPIQADTLARLQQAWPLSDLRKTLLQQYPHNHAGHHLLKLHSRIHLHLILGDVRDTLPQLNARIDAWYLDGFAPAKNPECWTHHLFATLAYHSNTQATAATFSAARHVREALTQAGFHVEKIAGYGRKRDMLIATLKQAQHTQPHWSNMPAATSGSIAIIGAGIAGSTTARALAESGREIVLYNSPDKPAASAVPIAVPYLKPDSENTLERPYQLAAWHHALRALHSMSANTFSPCDIVCHATRDTEKRRQRAILTGQLLNHHELRGGQHDDIIYLRGGRIHLPELLTHLREHPKIKQDHKTCTHLEALDEHAAIILCCGWHSELIPETLIRKAMRPVRGQGTLFRSDQIPAHVFCSHRTLIPYDDEHIYSGASFTPNNYDLTPQIADDEENRLALIDHLPHADITDAHHFVGIRSASRDYMPFVGAIGKSSDIAEKYAAWRYDARRPVAQNIEHHPRLYIHQALGSKGCTHAWLNADTLDAIINATPIPLPQNQLEHLSPTRYLLRALKRGQL